MRLSRISKLFVDRDDITVSEALARRKAHAVSLICGTDVGTSYTLQLAVLTAAALATRCFPGAVRVALDERLVNSPLLVWSSLRRTFGQTLSRIVGADALTTSHPGHGYVGEAVVFGNVAAPPSEALRVTFDGWIAAAGPARTVDRLPERDYCPLSGILAASIAVSEIFMSFAAVSVEAPPRDISVSLWRPDIDVHDPAARGLPIEYLPKELWVLGLGHLGNAYLWTLAGLRYRDPGEVKVVLNDFDRVEPDNVETGLLLTDAARGRFKTRVCSAWLESRGFQSRIVERCFDAHFFCRSDEPQLALCGFDENSARRPLAAANFSRVVESGLGGTADNFDTLSIHALPNPRSASELWPDTPSAEREAESRRRELVAQRSRGYTALQYKECGRVKLAGKSVAVPFVGTAAASFVLAETVRLFHNGPAYTDLKLRLSVPSDLRVMSRGVYGARDATLPFSCSQ